MGRCYFSRFFFVGDLVVGVREGVRWVNEGWKERM